MTITVYKCTNPKCDNTDRDHGANPPAPASLICKCRHEMLPTSPDKFVDRDGTRPYAGQPTDSET